MTVRTSPKAASGARHAMRPVARGVAVALTVLALGACSSDDDDDDDPVDGGDDGDVPGMTTGGGDTDGGEGTGGLDGTDGSPSGDFAVVMNDGASAGNVQIFSPDLATMAMTRESGLNQGIAFGPDGALYQNGDADGATGTFSVDENGTTTQIGTAPGKGLVYVAVGTGAAALVSCDVTDETADMKLYDPMATGGTDPAATIDLPAPCWDSFYDGEGDRLYVALTDGRLGIFDAFAARYDDGSGTLTAPGDVPALDRTVTPVDGEGNVLSTNFHGVFVEDGTVLVSDVGDAASPTDGLLFVFEDGDDASLDGNVETASIGGPTTMLGNPVDVVLVGGTAIVAEKSNDVLLAFEDVADAIGDDSDGTMGGDMMADYSTPFTKPESIELAPDMGGEDGTTDGMTDGGDGTTDGEVDGTTDGEVDGGTIDDDVDGTTDGTDGEVDGGDGTTDGTDGTTDGEVDGTTDGTDGTTDGEVDGTTDG